MALKALDVKNFSCPVGKSQIKKSDGNGLFLLIKINGSKLWRFRFRYSGKYQEMALGKYPSVSLSEARKLAEEARASFDALSSRNALIVSASMASWLCWDFFFLFGLGL